MFMPCNVYSLGTEIVKIILTSNVQKKTEETKDKNLTKYECIFIVMSENVVLH